MTNARDAFTNDFRAIRQAARDASFADLEANHSEEAFVAWDSRLREDPLMVARRHRRSRTPSFRRDMDALGVVS